MRGRDHHPIGRDLEAPAGAEVIDAAGKYVFPGFIDPHVHIYLPFMGTFAKDTHTAGSQAALVGGTTTFIEMVPGGPTQPALAAFEKWTRRPRATAPATTRSTWRHDFNEDTEAQLREIVAAARRRFKVFLAYKGALDVNDDELYQTLELARELGVMVTAHCENAELVGAPPADAAGAGQDRARVPRAQPARAGRGRGHPPLRHLRGDDRGARVRGPPQQRRLARGRPGRQARGASLTIEAVIPHLILDESYAQRPDFEGAKYVMSPPLRTKADQAALWRALEHGLIDTVGTDHAPFDFHGQKDMGKDDFTKIPNGIPAIEDRVNLLYTYGVSRGALDLHRFVDAASTRAAKLFGLFPRKGTIAVGSDADLVVYDPAYRGTLSAARQTMNVDYNGFEGMEIDGRPSVVTVRGKVAVRDGAFVGDPERGRMLRRPTLTVDSPPDALIPEEEATLSSRSEPTPSAGHG